MDKDHEKDDLVDDSIVVDIILTPDQVKSPIESEDEDKIEVVIDLLKEINKDKQDEIDEDQDFNSTLDEVVQMDDFG